jgi:uncharacterized damage-inducible protein DinB
MGKQEKRDLTIRPLPGYPVEIGAWLWTMADSRRRTKNWLEGISQEVIDWVPPDGVNTIGTLLYHIAAVEMEWLHFDVLGLDEYPPEVKDLLPYPAHDEQDNLTRVAGELLETHLERLDACREIFLKAFEEIDPHTFTHARETESSMVTPQWVVHLLAQHEADIRGQIGELRTRAEIALGIKSKTEAYGG